jgi:hypothetical protein
MQALFWERGSPIRIENCVRDGVTCTCFTNYRDKVYPDRVTFNRA